MWIRNNIFTSTRGRASESCDHRNRRSETQNFVSSLSFVNTGDQFKIFCLYTTGSGYVLVDIFLLGGILHFFHSMGPRDQEKFGCQLGKW